MKINIQQLKELNAKENEGKGISCVESFIKCVERNDIKTAKFVYIHDGDKIRSYPKIQQWFYENLGCRIHNVIDCDSWLCKEIRKYHDQRIQFLKN